MRVEFTPEVNKTWSKKSTGHIMWPTCQCGGCVLGSDGGCMFWTYGSMYSPPTAHAIMPPGRLCCHDHHESGTQLQNERHTVPIKVGWLRAKSVGKQGSGYFFLICLKAAIGGGVTWMFHGDKGLAFWSQHSGCYHPALG